MGRVVGVRKTHNMGPFRVNFVAYRISSVTCWWGPGHRKVLWQKKRSR